ncbi:YdbL family protein [Rhodospirillaceae bacterium KN72]|uniref:YdbL family protein n=2 Tax=Pacificispira spongiicola TaxID=2729598 RepID=A0A7Y0DYR0_9PROT|nr:YdbL family protein [Pacificispira spongiicola]
MSKIIRFSNSGRFSSPGRFSRTRRAFLALAALFTVSVTGLPAMAADSLDGPRSAGIVGERFDGYAVVRDGADSSVQSLVQTINAKRQAYYQAKAAEQNVDIMTIQEVYAKAIFDKAPKGWWFLTPSGWTQK